MAMNKLPAIEKNYEVYNLGTGCGYSVLEVVKGFEKAMGAPLNYVIGEPRHGDVAKLVANIDKGTKECFAGPTFKLLHQRNYRMTDQ